MKKPELLAPAGDMEKLIYALAYGADAVYVGGSSFGLRAYAGNFGNEQLKEAVALVHGKKRKIYVTVNIFAHEQDLAELPVYLRELGQLGVDAIIVSDPGIIVLAQQIVPGLPIHLSTQANSTNSSSVNYWLKQGLARVILARELTLSELRLIRSRVSGQLEIFIHGAMCMSYSGRCLLSNYLTGRDANRGECTQPCRWGYSLVEEKRPGQAFPVEEDRQGTYIFNSYDLCLLPYLPLLKQLGIESWKIEGRMKSLYYVASTLKVYREAIDTLWEQGEEAFQARLPEWLEETAKVSHRDYSSGFLFGKPGADAHNLENSHYVREYDFVGVSFDNQSEAQIPAGQQAKGDMSPQTVLLEQRNNFKPGETLEVLAPLEQPWTFKIGKMWNLAGEELEAARHAQEIIKLKLARSLPPYSILRRAKNQDYC
ncbi:MAG TPA: U32 family peptidase [Desulfitobacteriaceae bacterium]|nr:U32 family peptidase [Desulfitobacteriaceae bacterium]